MQLKYPFEIMEMDDAFVAVPVGDECDFHGVLRVNDSAKSIIELLAEDITEAGILKALHEKYEATDEELLESVNALLTTLRAEALLIE